MWRVVSWRGSVIRWQLVQGATPPQPGDSRERLEYGWTEWKTDCVHFSDQQMLQNFPHLRKTWPVVHVKTWVYVYVRGIQFDCVTSDQDEWTRAGLGPAGDELDSGCCWAQCQHTVFHTLCVPVPWQLWPFSLVPLSAWLSIWTGAPLASCCRELCHSDRQLVWHSAHAHTAWKKSLAVA